MTTDIEDQTRCDPNRKNSSAPTASICNRSRFRRLYYTKRRAFRRSSLDTHYMARFHGIAFGRKSAKLLAKISLTHERRARRELCAHAWGFAQRRSQARQPKLDLPRDESVPLDGREGARAPGLRQRHARHLYWRAEPAVFCALWLPPRRRLAGTVAISTSVDNLRT